MTLSGAASAGDDLVQARSFKADARAAARQKIPIMVLFSSPECHYCERVKREYLIPMQKDPAYRKKVIIREVTVDANTPLTDFDGTATTEATFAAFSKVFMVPTVKVFDARGNEASEAIVGLLIADFYFGYLEAAIEEGTRKMRGK
ncbi:MAG: hypothetical protein B7X93_12545 [Hydrogenophilales bacterium 17-61-9]|nr:MAG: hypothetical protein B7X93_12545 [Hydrogenophilales bacterium 17-61-9]